MAEYSEEEIAAILEGYFDDDDGGNDPDRRAFVRIHLRSLHIARLVLESHDNWRVITNHDFKLAVQEIAKLSVAVARGIITREAQDPGGALQRYRRARKQTSTLV